MRTISVKNSLAEARATVARAGRRVPFTDAYQVAGEPARAAEMLVEGWAVVELSDLELSERIRIGRQRRIDELLELADKARERARQLLGTKFADRHTADARRYKIEAESLQDDVTEPITSPERDLRPSEAL